MTNTIRITILGASGRMGRALISALRDNSSCRLVAALGAPDDLALGEDAGIHAGGAELGVLIDSDMRAAVDACDVLVDFSSPEATVSAIKSCARYGKPVVSGTTGLTAAQQAAVVEASRRIAICQAANYSIGINVCLKLVGQAAKALGSDYDVEIVEAHHRGKIDAPSGTALALGRSVALASNRDLDANAVYSRQGITGPRDRSSIGFASIRGGDVVGDHRVLFLGDGEQLEISHRASNRANFAHGALRAAGWLIGGPPGLYDMQDVLGLR